LSRPTLRSTWLRPPCLARQPVFIAGRQHRNLPCQPHQV
jgi:hypothetical protein